MKKKIQKQFNIYKFCKEKEKYFRKILNIKYKSLESILF
jgi:hypothetical protein